MMRCENTALAAPTSSHPRYTRRSLSAHVVDGVHVRSACCSVACSSIVTRVQLLNGTRWSLVNVHLSAAVVSTLVSGLDFLAQVTGDPQFTQIADSVKQVIPAQYHPLFPAALAAIGIAARLRTAGK